MDERHQAELRRVAEEKERLLSERKAQIEFNMAKNLSGKPS